MIRSSTRWYALILVALLTACGSGSTGVPPETTSIAVVADNQVGFEAWNATRTTNPSSANLAQLQRTIADIASRMRPYLRRPRFPTPR